MDKKRRRGVVALLLILSIGNYFRIDGHGDVRTVVALSIFAVGLFAGILITDLAHLYRNRQEDKDKMV